jgi:hypothetical protein
MFLRYERRCVTAIFETVLPSESCAAFPLGARDMPIDAFLDHVSRNAPAQFLLGLRIFTWVVTFAPIFVLGRFTTFLGLAAPEQFQLLEALRGSSTYALREIPLFFKMVACLGFCGLPDVQRLVGVAPRDATPPPWATPVLATKAARLLPRAP